jgi:SAM-dependent methyltransferase
MGKEVVMIGDAAKRALASPLVFDLYQKAVGAPKCLSRFVESWIKPEPGDRLLDIGCGTGAIIPYLPQDVELVGVDISSSYIRAASSRFGDRGTFLVGDASDHSLNLGRPFDIAFASGVLHHISDDGVRSVLSGVIERLKQGGRFVAIDPTLVPNQGWLSRSVVKADRGEFVRSPSELSELLREYKPTMTVVTDMLKIPYAQVITTIVKS